MLPPIRYPLPTLVALILAGLLGWLGLELSKTWRAEMAQRLKLAVEGPPVPSSPKPQTFVGSIPRRALLLKDQTLATARPNGSTVETIDRRMFVDVYDLWPSPGPTSHVRVGNRKPIGWIPVDDVLFWNTRLVIRAPGGKLALADTPDTPGQTTEVGRESLPVLRWSPTSVEVALWTPSAPWSKVARTGWIRIEALPPESWGVWISQVELPILLGLANQGEEPGKARLRAVLGRLADNRPLTLADVEATRKELPAIVLQNEPDPRKAAERLAEENARPRTEAGWSGLNFRFLPLGDLP